MLTDGLKSTGAGTVVSVFHCRWPDHPRVRFSSPPPGSQELRDLLGLKPSDPAIPDQKMKELLRSKPPWRYSRGLNLEQFPIE